MKTSRVKYSKFNKQFMQQVEVYGKMTDEDLKKSIKNFPYVENSEYASLNSLKSFHDIGYENIFIETGELYQFLKETKVITHGDIAGQIYTAIENRDCQQTESNGRKYRRYNFMLNAPIDKINTSLAVTIITSNIELPNANNDLYNSLTWTGKPENGASYIVLCENTFSGSKENYWNKNDIEEFSIIINTLFYMNAFPDYVSEGVPKRAIIDGDCFKNKRITLNPNTEFLNRLSVSPHLRRGHFRTFTSDYYKNMKGKTIWIDPVFVNGKAMTVVDGISA